MADASMLEYYKLAAQIIPVLWLGTALQRLDRTTTLARLVDAEQRRGTIKSAQAPEGAQPGRTGEGAPVHNLAFGFVDALVNAQAQLIANEIQHTATDAFARIARALSLCAIVLAMASEVLALYGVANACTAVWMTVAITVGLAAGALLLFAPLVIGWARLFDDAKAGGGASRK